MSSIRKAAVFSDTPEGRMLCQKLCERQIPVTAFVASRMGEDRMQPNQYLTIMTGKISREGMREILGSYSVVVDATHPLASDVTADIQAVCKELGIPHLLVRRDQTNAEYGIYVDSAREAAKFLNEHEGNALLTVSGKDLESFNKVTNYKERFVVKTAPTIDSILTCNMAGFMGKQIAALQDMASIQLYRALLEELRGDYLVAKESDDDGGMEVKAEAAKLAGARLIVIQRPIVEHGMSIDETVQLTLQFLSI